MSEKHIFSVSLDNKLNDCIRNTTAVCNPRQNPRQNSVRGKIQSKTKFSLRKIFLLEKKLSENFFSDFQCAFFELFRTNQCLTSLSGIYIPQLLFQGVFEWVSILTFYAWPNKFAHSEGKKPGGARIRAGAIIGTNQVQLKLYKPHRFPVRKLYLPLEWYYSVADPGFPVGARGPVGGGVDPRCGHFLVKMYAKTKELGPVGGDIHQTRPVDPPMIYNFKHV